MQVAQSCALDASWDQKVHPLSPDFALLNTQPFGLALEQHTVLASHSIRWRARRAPPCETDPSVFTFVRCADRAACLGRDRNVQGFPPRHGRLTAARQIASQSGPQDHNTLAEHFKRQSRNPSAWRQTSGISQTPGIRTPLKALFSPVKTSRNPSLAALANRTWSTWMICAEILFAPFDPKEDTFRRNAVTSANICPRKSAEL